MTPKDIYVTVDLPNNVRFVCDECGKPAWCAALDITQLPTNDGWARYKVYGKPKYGCEEHKVVSHTYDVDGNLIR